MYVQQLNNLYLCTNYGRDCVPCTIYISIYCCTVVLCTQTTGFFPITDPTPSIFNPIFSNN